MALTPSCFDVPDRDACPAARSGGRRARAGGGRVRARLAIRRRGGLRRHQPVQGPLPVRGDLPGSDGGDTTTAPRLPGTGPGEGVTQPAPVTQAPTTAPPGTSPPSTAPPSTAPGPESWQLQQTPASMGGCQTFDRTSVFHSVVTGLPVHPRSDEFLGHIGLDSPARAAIRSSVWNGTRPGIPFNYVDSRLTSQVPIDLPDRVPGRHVGGDGPDAGRPPHRGRPHPELGPTRDHPRHRARATTSNSSTTSGCTTTCSGSTGPLPGSNGTWAPAGHWCRSGARPSRRPPSWRPSPGSTRSWPVGSTT